jgi:uncharacterized C2H2 Zn-finger protein
MAQNQGFRCPACGAEFSTQQRLDDHKKESHASSQSGGQGRPQK